MERKRWTHGQLKGFVVSRLLFQFPSFALCSVELGCGMLEETEQEQSRSSSPATVSAEAIKPLTLAAPISPPAVVQGYLGLWRDQLDRAERAKPLLLQKQVSCLHLLLHCTLPPAL